MILNESYASKKGLNTPYDDAFKSVISKCPALTIPLINEMFFHTGLSDEKKSSSRKISPLRIRFLC